MGDNRGSRRARLEAVRQQLQDCIHMLDVCGVAIAAAHLDSALHAIRKAIEQCADSDNGN